MYFMYWKQQQKFALPHCTFEIFKYVKPYQRIWHKSQKGIRHKSFISETKKNDENNGSATGCLRG